MTRVGNGKNDGDGRSWTLRIGRGVRIHCCNILLFLLCIHFAHHLFRLYCESQRKNEIKRMLDFKHHLKKIFRNMTCAFYFFYTCKYCV